MTGIDLSEYLRANYPIDVRSLARRKGVEGAGINDADYMVKCKGRDGVIICPAYNSWSNMFKSKCVDATVSHEWLSFMRFREWWVDNYVDGFVLARGLIDSDRLTFSSKTCVYVPHWLAFFTNLRKRARGSWPIGVRLNNRNERFDASCSHPETSKNEYLGSFSSVELAHAAWLARKLEHAYSLKPKMDEIDKRIYPNVCQLVTEAE